MLASVESLIAVFGDRPFPRSAFRPAMLPRMALPFACLIDCNDQPAGGWTFRLFGTGLRDAVGREMTGEPLSAFPKDGEKGSLQPLAQSAFDQQMAQFSAVRMEFADRRVTSERLVLPLLEADGRVPMILALVFDGSPDRGRDRRSEDRAPRRIDERVRTLDRLGDLMGPYRHLGAA